MTTTGENCERDAPDAAREACASAQSRPQGAQQEQEAIVGAAVEKVEKMEELQDLDLSAERDVSLSASMLEDSLILSTEDRRPGGVPGEELRAAERADQGRNSRNRCGRGQDARLLSEDEHDQQKQQHEEVDVGKKMNQRRRAARSGRATKSTRPPASEDTSSCSSASARSGAEFSAEEGEGRVVATRKSKRVHLRILPQVRHARAERASTRSAGGVSLVGSRGEAGRGRSSKGVVRYAEDFSLGELQHRGPPARERLHIVPETTRARDEKRRESPPRKRRSGGDAGKARTRSGEHRRSKSRGRRKKRSRSSSSESQSVESRSESEEDEVSTALRYLVRVPVKAARLCLTELFPAQQKRRHPRTRAHGGATSRRRTSRRKRDSRKERQRPRQKSAKRRQSRSEANQGDERAGGANTAIDGAGTSTAAKSPLTNNARPEQDATNKHQRQQLSGGDPDARPDSMQLPAGGNPRHDTPSPPPIDKETLLASLPSADSHWAELLLHRGQKWQLSAADPKQTRTLLDAIKEAAETGFQARLSRRVSWASRLAQLGVGVAEPPANGSTTAAGSCYLGLVAFLLHVFFEFQPGEVTWYYIGSSSYALDPADWVSVKCLLDTLRYALALGNGRSSAGMNAGDAGVVADLLLQKACDTLFSFCPLDPWGICGYCDQQVKKRARVRAEVEAFLMRVELPLPRGKSVTATKPASTAKDNKDLPPDPLAASSIACLTPIHHPVRHPDAGEFGCGTHLMHSFQLSPSTVCCHEDAKNDNSPPPVLGRHNGDGGRRRALPLPGEADEKSLMQLQEDGDDAPKNAQLFASFFRSRGNANPRMQGEDSRFDGDRGRGNGNASPSEKSTSAELRELLPRKMREAMEKTSSSGSSDEDASD